MKKGVRVQVISETSHISNVKFFADIGCKGTVIHDDSSDVLCIMLDCDIKQYIPIDCIKRLHVKKVL